MRTRKTQAWRGERATIERVARPGTTCLSHLLCQLQEQPAHGRSRNRCGGDERRRSQPVARVQEPTCYGSKDEPQRDREDDEEHDPCSQLMLAAWSIEGHSGEHRKGRGDDSPHAAGNREHDKDDAIVELGHEGTWL